MATSSRSHEAPTPREQLKADRGPSRSKYFASITIPGLGGELGPGACKLPVWEFERLLSRASRMFHVEHSEPSAPRFVLVPMFHVEHPRRNRAQSESSPQSSKCSTWNRIGYLKSLRNCLRQSSVTLVFHMERWPRCAASGQSRGFAPFPTPGLPIHSF
jgi:hypothetical protein